MQRLDESEQMSELARRLSVQFDVFGEDEVAKVVRECHLRFVGSPIRDFIPLLVEHSAREQLRAMSTPVADPQAGRRTPSPARISLLQLAFGDGRAWAIL